MANKDVGKPGHFQWGGKLRPGKRATAAQSKAGSAARRSARGMKRQG